MIGKPEVLFLTHRIPYPPDKGDKIRSWRLLRHLSERYDVHLACFVDDPRDFEHVGYLRRLCRSVECIPLYPRSARARSARGFLTGKALSLAYYRDRKMQRAVNRIRMRPLAAEFVFCSTMAQYVEPAMPNRARVVDFCDADSEKWRQYAGEAQRPMRWIYLREAKLLARAESAIAASVDVSFAITSQEAAIFNKRDGAPGRVKWWSNGVDTDYFSPTAPLLKCDAPADIVFTGAMDYRANVDAAHFFLDAVWPKIRSLAPQTRFAIVGARPQRSLRLRHGKDGVIITGRIDDVRPWLRESKLVVAPLRVARGLQNKVLEAMAMAKPVVATGAAATGLVASRGEAIMIADTAEETAHAILSLLNGENARARIGLAARSAMLENYAWTAQLKRFDDALQVCIDDQAFWSSAVSLAFSA